MNTAFHDAAASFEQVEANLAMRKAALLEQQKALEQEEARIAHYKSATKPHAGFVTQHRPAPTTTVSALAIARQHQQQQHQHQLARNGPSPSNGGRMPQAGPQPASASVGLPPPFSPPPCASTAQWPLILAAIIVPVQTIFHAHEAGQVGATRLSTVDSQPEHGALQVQLCHVGC